MEVFGIFRRDRIATAEALGDFFDQQALLDATAIVEDNTRARAGAAAAGLLADAAFAPALERARWEAYPLFLTMLAELAASALPPQQANVQAALPVALQRLVLAVFDRHAAPAPLSGRAWAALRLDLDRWLADIPLRPPRPAGDIASSFAPSLLAVMPIHDLLRGENFPALRNELLLALSRAHDAFLRRARPRALAAALLRRR